MTLQRMAAIGITSMCTACISGSPVIPKTFPSSFLDKHHVTEKTQAAVRSYYDALARCNAYASASANGSADADNWQIGLSVSEGVLAGTSAVLAGLAGKNANESLTADPMVAEESAEQAETLGYVAAGAAGLGALLIAIDYAFGPIKQQKEYQSREGNLETILLDAEPHVQKFDELMTEGKPGEAQRELNKATTLLRGCRKAASGVRWNEKRLARYEDAARRHYNAAIEQAVGGNLLASQAKQLEELKKQAPIEQQQELQRKIEALEKAQDRIENGDSEGAIRILRQADIEVPNYLR